MPTGFSGTVTSVLFFDPIRAHPSKPDVPVCAIPVLNPASPLGNGASDSMQPTPLAAGRFA